MVTQKKYDMLKAMLIKQRKKNRLSEQKRTKRTIKQSSATPSQIKQIGKLLFQAENLRLEEYSEEFSQDGKKQSLPNKYSRLFADAYRKDLANGAESFHNYDYKEIVEFLINGDNYGMGADTGDWDQDEFFDNYPNLSELLEDTVVKYPFLQS